MEKNQKFYGGAKSLAGARVAWLREKTGGAIASSGSWAYFYALKFMNGEEIRPTQFVGRGRWSRQINHAETFRRLAAACGVRVAERNDAPRGGAHGLLMKAERPFLPDWWVE